MSFLVNRRSSGIYKGTLLDENGSPFGGAQTLTLTLVNKTDQTIINTRNHQNVLNQNQVTYDLVTGLITWNLLPIDNEMVNPALANEIHVATFVATWSGGLKELTHEVEINVKSVKQAT